MIIFSVWLVERLGRRPGLIWGAFVGSLPMWYLGGYVFKNDPATAAAAGEVSRSGAGYFAMVCVYLYGLIYCATWQGITWVYCSEIFPIDIRMLCVAITTADQWLWSFIISRTTPYMITSLGYGTYFFFATLMVLMGFWSYFFGKYPHQSWENHELTAFSLSSPGNQRQDVRGHGTHFRRIAPADSKDHRRRAGRRIGERPWREVRWSCKLRRALEQSLEICDS